MKTTIEAMKQAKIALLSPYTIDIATVVRDLAKAIAREEAQSVEPVKVGDIVEFAGESFQAVCRGDTPGTFDLHVHPKTRSGDQWRNVPASKITRPALTDGSWYKASDIDAMVRDLDVALNGENAAPQALLCDLMPSLIARLSSPTPTGERDELIQALRFFSYDMPAANCMMRKAADMLAAEARVPMTSLEIEKMNDANQNVSSVEDIVRVVEAHHGIKL